MRILLDVGAHVGETLEPALDERYRFDRIVCFEPVAACYAVLERFGDPRVRVCRFGLSNETARRPIYAAGSIGATFFRTDEVPTASELAELRRASDWFAEHVSYDDDVYLKLNCEGSECDIIDDLLDSGEIRKVTSALVDFDVRKFPSLTYREGQVRERLDRAGLSEVLHLKERYKGPTHTATIENWLRAAGAVSRAPSVRWRLRFVWMPTLIRKSMTLGRDWTRRLLSPSAYERLRLFIQKVVFRYPPDAEAIVILSVSIVAVTVLLGA